MSGAAWSAVEDYHRAYPDRLAGAEYRGAGVIVARWTHPRIWTEATPTELGERDQYRVTHHDMGRSSTATITADEWPDFLAEIGDRIDRDTPSA